jgi:hypothetical protein
MDGLEESPAEFGPVELGDMTAKLNAESPAAGATWSRLGNAEPEVTIRPNTEPHGSPQDVVEVHVESLEWGFEFPRALQFSMIPDCFAPTLDRAGDLKEQIGVEQSGTKGLHCRGDGCRGHRLPEQQKARSGMRAGLDERAWA